MAKREYSGPPIDGTGDKTKPPYAKNPGKTISGTSKDDEGDEGVSNWPTALDKDDFLPGEVRCIEVLAENDGASFARIAEIAGYSTATVYNARKKIKDMGLEDEVEFELGLEDQNKNNDSSEAESKLPQKHSNLLPDDLSEDDITSKQWKAVDAYVDEGCPENPQFYRLEKGRDFSGDLARSAIHKVFRETRGIEDIPDSARLGVLIWACEGMDEKQSTLAEKYPISGRALQEARVVYSDLIEEYDGLSESELRPAVKRYEENKKQVGKVRKSNEKKSKEPGGGKFQKAKDEKVYPDDFSETYKWFIEKISDDPSKSATEVRDEIPNDCDFGYANYYNVVSDYNHIIERLIQEKESANSPDDVCDYLLDQLELSFDGNSKESNSDNSESEPSQTEPEPNENLNNRLKAVESSVGKLRAKMESVDNGRSESSGNGKVELAEVIIQNMSDDQIGKVVRNAIEGGSE